MTRGRRDLDGDEKMRGGVVGVGELSHTLELGGGGWTVASNDRATEGSDSDL